MDLPNWIYIVGIVILNILLILIICMIVFKNKESDIDGKITLKEVPLKEFFIYSS